MNRFSRTINESKNNTINSNKENTDVIFDFYDIIIDINSINDIKQKNRWMIGRGKQNSEVYKTKDVLKIGVIGNANKGKSFILSKLSKIELPSGTITRTEGLSKKYPELEEFKDRKIALLDSAELDTPVLRENEIDTEISKE